jgi:hypothetical protein
VVGVVLSADFDSEAGQDGFQLVIDPGRHVSTCVAPRSPRGRNSATDS